MKRNRIISFILTAVMLFGTLAATLPVSAALSFNDTDGHWGKTAIEYVVEKGLMNGVGNGESFAPDMSLTRGMVVTVLYRDNGSPNQIYQAVFPDVAEGQYYTAAAEWAYANNIVNGTGFDEWGDPYFSADRDITRGELATMFKRYADFKHVDTSKGGADIDSFPDAASVADWAKEAVKWAVGVGLIKCAHSAIRHKDSYFYAKYCRISARRGGKRALVAIAHSMALAIYHILLDKEHFCDLGSDYFNTIYAEKIKKRNIQSLEKLGFSVSLS